MVKGFTYCLLFSASLPGLVPSFNTKLVLTLLDLNLVADSKFLAGKRSSHALQIPDSSHKTRF